jgi:hypothetical protein
MRALALRLVKYVDTMLSQELGCVVDGSACQEKRNHLEVTVVSCRLQSRWSVPSVPRDDKPH